MTTTTEPQPHVKDDAANNHDASVPVPIPPPPPGTFMSEEEYFRKSMSENHAFPVLLTLVCAGSSLSIYTMKGLSEGGTTMATSMALAVGILLVATTVIGTLTAWFVAKIFDENFGSFGVLMLRIAAVSSTELLLYFGLSTVIGPYLPLLVGLPMLILLTCWLVGMNLFQAFVFAIVLKIVEMLLISFTLISIVSKMME